eukprot:658980_1
MSHLFGILYLMTVVYGYWKPTPGTTWQWQIDSNQSISDIYNVDMYDVDLFDTSAASISSLHAQNRKVICYFSAGSWEDWRPDANQFPDSVKGNHLAGWQREKWLNISDWNTLRPVMTNRMDLAVSKQCDGIHPDNVDGYASSNGFNLTFNDQITYNIHLATEAHARDLAIGLKNALEQIDSLIDHFDFAINEECNTLNECDSLLKFTQNNKTVFGVEYDLDVTQFCDKMNAFGFDFLVKNWDLDACVYACRDYPCKSSPDCLAHNTTYTGTGGQCYDYPTTQPSTSPTNHPLKNPTADPSVFPTNTPSFDPTNGPTSNPTINPSSYPSSVPITSPTQQPIIALTDNPTNNPTNNPTINPTVYPTEVPTRAPIQHLTVHPSVIPTNNPTLNPTNNPTLYPTETPTRDPLNKQTKPPTYTPTNVPTVAPTQPPTFAFAYNHTDTPTVYPTKSPHIMISGQPTTYPSVYPMETSTNVPLMSTVDDNDEKDTFANQSLWDTIWTNPILKIIFIGTHAVLICICCICIGCCIMKRRHYGNYKHPTNPEQPTFMAHTPGMIQMSDGHKLPRGVEFVDESDDEDVLKNWVRKNSNASVSYPYAQTKLKPSKDGDTCATEEVGLKKAETMDPFDI